MMAAGMAERCGRKGGITFHSLRHTFGTRMAAVGVPMRTLQEWMGHRDFTTTLVYADFAPDPAGGAAFAERAFGSVAPRPGLASVSARTNFGQRPALEPSSSGHGEL
jgi:Phage integrase family